MRLIITECKYCLHNRETCEYKLSLRENILKIKQPGSLNHRCLPYRELFSYHQPVLVILRDQDITTSVDESGYVHKEIQWTFNCFETGRIVEGPKYRRLGTYKFMYLVQLNHKHTLLRECLERTIEYAWRLPTSIYPPEPDILKDKYPSVYAEYVMEKI